MIKGTKVQKEVTEEHKFCDGCGVEISIGLACSAARCSYCGKDLCEACIGHEDSTSGDYRDVYCKQCWQLGDKYRPIIKEYSAKLDDLYIKWQNECKSLD